MTLAATYSGEIRGTTFGLPDDEARWTAPPSGLGLPSPDTADLPLNGNRSVGGLDRIRRRIIKVPLILVGVGPVDLDDVIDATKQAWRAASTDTTLDLRLGGDTRRYYGRPRGLDLDLVDHRWGVAEGTGEFHALDPWGYGDEVTAGADSSSPIILTNDGTTATTRCTLTIAGNGGTPVITNTDDPDNGRLVFNRTLGVGDAYVVELTGQTVTKSGTSVEGHLSASSEWFQLEPGDNTITFTGCASVAATFRPAYL